MKNIFLKRFVDNKNKKASATIVVIIASFVIMIYAQSTYSDVIHMKNMYNTQEKIILEKYKSEYNDSFLKLGI